jgi:pantoate--beta-alanine ligase
VTPTPFTVSRVTSLRRRVDGWKRRGQSIAFVPTMGALHDGHRRLIERAAGKGRRVVVSIFVNPTQFGPGEDYAAYPRARRADLKLCREAGADLVFAPGVREVYPAGFATTVHVEGLDRTLCAPHRPGHFDGVTTVVLKLLEMVRPDRLLLGRKDAQQAVICGRMIRDLNLPVVLQVIPTVREPDGLAISSRNRYLTQEERAAAPALYQALDAGRRAIAEGERSAKGVIDLVRRRLDVAGLFRVQYIELVDPRTLEPVEPKPGEQLLAAAAFLGRARLIDNIVVRTGRASRRDATRGASR